MFGKSVALNIDGEDTYNTWIGGFFSLLISLLMFGYVYMLLSQMFTYGNDTVALLFPDLSTTTLGKVSYKK